MCLPHYGYAVANGLLMLKVLSGQTEIASFYLLAVGNAVLLVADVASCDLDQVGCS